MVLAYSINPKTRHKIFAKKVGMEKKSLCEYLYSPKGLVGHKCGYCKSPDTNISQGMWTHLLTVDDYQDLLDRGWRRSGKYCYKPAMSKTCCPMYAISCQATKFRLSKSQKAVLKKVANYLVEGVGSTEELQGEKAHNSTTSAAVKKPVQPGKGADPSKPSCRKAKVLRKERREKRVLSSSASVVEGGMEGLIVGGVRVKKSEASVSDTASKEGAVPDFLKVGSDGKKPLEVFLTLPPPAIPGAPNAHELEIKLIRSSPPSDEFRATFAESYSVFKKYQMSVHKEAEKDCQQSMFQRFLCDSPLVPRKGQKGWPCDYGSYHQQYRIDRKLVAVGVFDILPKCLSSVYVFYDPDSSFLTLGVYSALRELELTRKLYLGDTERFKYYYMGYYVHSCPKMRYKRDYSPSFLLCPESYHFVTIEQCAPKLDANKYSRFSNEESAPEDVDQWLAQALVLVQRTCMTYGEFCGFVPERLKHEVKVRQYAQLVGPQVTSRMLLVLDQGE